MKRFALIDIHSGYVWGTTRAADPISACRRVDTDIGEPGRRYEKHGPDSGAEREGKTGYLVHEIPDRMNVDYLMKFDALTAVEAHPCIAVVLVKDAEDAP